MAVSLLKTYAPGTRVLLTNWRAWGKAAPYFGRVTVCLDKWSGAEAATVASQWPMHVRWDAGHETHEGADLAPVSNIYR